MDAAGNHRWISGCRAAAEVTAGIQIDPRRMVAGQHTIIGEIGLNEVLLWSGNSRLDGHAVLFNGGLEKPHPEVL